MDGWHLALLLAGVAILGAALLANRFVSAACPLATVTLAKHREVVAAVLGSVGVAAGGAPGLIAVDVGGGEESHVLQLRGNEARREALVA